MMIGRKVMKGYIYTRSHHRRSNLATVESTSEQDPIRMDMQCFEWTINPKSSDLPLQKSVYPDWKKIIPWCAIIIDEMIELIKECSCMQIMKSPLPSSTRSWSFNVGDSLYISWNFTNSLAERSLIMFVFKLSKKFFSRQMIDLERYENCKAISTHSLTPIH